MVHVQGDAGGSCVITGPLRERATASKYVSAQCVTHWEESSQGVGEEQAVTAVAGGVSREMPLLRSSGGGETIEHIIVECSRWDKERSKYIGMLMNRLEMQHLPSSGKCVLLLGGEYMGHRLCDWLPPQRKQTIATSGEHGHRVATQCGAFQMARYLQGIEKPRALILSEVRRSEDVPTLQSLGPSNNSIG